jgi:hypothetical protein
LSFSSAKGLVLCQGQLLWFPLVCLTVFRFAIYGFQLTEEFLVLSSDTIPDRRECGRGVFLHAELPERLTRENLFKFCDKLIPEPVEFFERSHLNPT